MAKLQRRNIQHSFAPDKGLAQDMTPTLIPERNTPECSSILFQFGEVSKSSGYVKFGSTGQPLSWDGTDGLRVMALPDFTLLDGTAKYLALTLEDAFEYDGSQKSWRAMGLVLDDGATVWSDASGGEVTPSKEETDFKVGAESAKLVLSDAATAGNLAYVATVSTANNLTTPAVRNKIHFWIKSTVNQTASKLQIILSQAADLSSEDLAINIPALTANTWVYFHLDAVCTGLDSIDSVGLKAISGFTNDCTIYIDDIRVSTKFTNTKNDQWTWCSQAGNGSLQETVPTWFLILTNGVDTTLKWDGSTAELVSLTGTLGSGNLLKSKVAISYKDTLGLMNNTENVSAKIPQRFRHGDTAEEDDWITGVAGFIDCYDTPGEILAATVLGPYLVIYKSDGIVLLQYNAFASPVFDKTPRITGSQFFATKAIGSANNVDYFLARDNVYSFSGLHETTKIGDPVRDNLLGALDFGKKDECFAFVQPGTHRITFVVPTRVSTNYTVWYRYNYLEKTWSKGVWGHYITCAGNYEGGSAVSWGQASGTWGDAIGVWADLVQEKEDKSVLLGDADGFVYQLADTLTDYDGSAINAEWQTKDFALSPDYMIRNMRFGKLAYAARGDLISVDYSTDEGLTWTNLVTDQILTPERLEYKISLNFSTVRARFKFYDATVGKDFFLSHVSIEYMITTTRD